MNNKVTWLRISYWVGAVADGLATLRMLFPKIAYGGGVQICIGLGCFLDARLDISAGLGG